MKDLVFVSAQPDIPYFHWQVKVYIHNFIDKGVIPEQIHVLFAMVDKQEPTIESLELKKFGVNIHHYPDIRTDKKYIPSLRPMILKEWLKENPELGKCYFYHDSDIIFRELPDFDSMIDDDICYLSDTRSYLGYNYIMDCSKRYETTHKSLFNGQLFHNMCNIINIPYDIVYNNRENSGGAQYLIKNTDYTFWEKVYNDCINLYNFLFNFHKTHPIQHSIQMWTADMWAVLWNIWLLGKETKITDKLSFCWGTDSVETYEKHPIFHLAGVTDNLKKTKFYKGEYINVNPLSKLKDNFYHFNYVDKHSSTIKYVDVMKEIVINENKLFVV